MEIGHFLFYFFKEQLGLAAGTLQYDRGLALHVAAIAGCDRPESVFAELLAPPPQDDPEPGDDGAGACGRGGGRRRRRDPDAPRELTAEERLMCRRATSRMIEMCACNLNLAAAAAAAGD